MMPDRFFSAFNTAERWIEERYDVPVRVRDVPAPFTGDLDGAEIYIDYDIDAETALFNLVHLFGHTVQWNLSQRSRELSLLQESLSGPLDSTLSAELESFEREACEFSMTLLHDAGVRELDGWISDFSACDFRYLMHFYNTGKKLPLRSFWRDDQPLISPRPIPDFRPTRWIARGRGIVI